MTTHITLPTQFKFATDSAEGVFTGIASTYGGEPDRHGDVIALGAFSETLETHEKAGTRPAMLWQHDQTAPVGVWSAFEDTASGLVVHGRLALDLPQAKAAHELMKMGALSLSIGFMIPAGGYEIKQGVRIIKSIDLAEISLVALPANQQAKITSVKSLELNNPREFEAAAREALGLSVRQSKRLMAGGYRSLVREEQADNDEELAAIADDISRINQRLKKYT